MALAGEGQVLVSDTTRDLLGGSGLAHEDAGIHELKGRPKIDGLFRAIQP